MARDDDEVGYGRPPRSGQFKPGRSGNPRGRPKGAASFKSDLATEMRECITLRDKNGRSHRVTKQRALVKLLFSSALQNEKSAIGALLACMRYFGAGNEELAQEPVDLEDLEMIRSYVARTEARIKHEKDPMEHSTVAKKRGRK
jgi:Family of unknown function (DUF5681)